MIKYSLDPAGEVLLKAELEKILKDRHKTIDKAKLKWGFSLKPAAKAAPAKKR
jgi:hypothetical protein